MPIAPALIDSLKGYMRTALSIEVGDSVMRLLKFIMQWVHSPVIVAEKSKVWRFLRIDNMRRVRNIQIPTIVYIH